MKILLKTVSGALLILSLAFFLSSFNSPQTNDNNGVIVTITKGQFWSYRACGQWVTSSSSFRQNKGSKIHLITLIFDLPEGHCMIPENKAVKTTIGDFDVVFTPSGKLIAKYIDNSK
jgi:hypothetical protein